MNRRHFLKVLTVGAVGLTCGVSLFKQRELNVPIRWSAPWPQHHYRETDQKKIELAKRLIAKAIESHDQLIEEAIFGANA